MLDLDRIDAVKHLRELARSGGTVGLSHERIESMLRSILGRLTCCDRDSDADGNCPLHRVGGRRKYDSAARSTEL